MLKAVTFDFWWTLFQHQDEEGAIRLRTRRIKDFLGGQGYAFDDTTIRMALDEVRAISLDYQYNRGRDFTPAEQVAYIFARLGVVDLNGELADEFYPIYEAVLMEIPPEPMPGAEQVLAALSRRYPLGLVCNTGTTPGSVLRQIMAGYGLAKYFTHLTFSNEVRIAKPDPEIFHLTLREMGVTGPAVHIGDDPITDIMGAQLAGLHTIWLQSRPVVAPPQGYEVAVAELWQVPQAIDRLVKKLK